jgi:PKD repeat protein
LSDYEGVTLSFWHTYDIEAGWDYGYVEYSTNGGSAWAQAASYSGEDQTTWSEETLTLTALDGQPNARIRFRLNSDSWITEDGWHIDDIVLSGSGPACMTPLSPTAEFSSNSPILLGDPAAFTNLTIGTVPLAYHWDFGDGVGTSTETAPQYTYLDTATYTVTLVATNTQGSDSVSHPVVVLPRRCVTVTDVGLTLVTTDTIYPNNDAEFSADIMPDDATKPYTYTLYPGTPITATTDPLNFFVNFDQPGTHTLEIAVWNCAMTTPLTDSVQVPVVEPPAYYYLYLPIIRKE